MTSPPAAPPRPTAAALSAADRDALVRAADLLGAAVVRVDGAGRVADLNGPADALVGGGAVGRRVGDVLPEDGPWAEAERIPTADGGCLVLLRDGAALQAAEADRDASQRLARALLVTIPDIVYLFDIGAGRNVWFNREIAEVTGYTADEMRAMGRGLNALVHSDDLEAWPAFVAERDGLPDGAFASFEYRVRHRDGRWRWLSARETVFARDADGRPAQAFGVAQDVTERKEAERTLAERAAHQGRIAEALQRPLLRAPVSGPAGGLLVHSVYRPASSEALVGGDFFDVVDLGAGRTALVVGDVMGKGLQAATGTAQAKFMLRTLLLEGYAPAAALARLNGHLYRTGLGDAGDPADSPFLAAAVAVVDVEGGAVRFAVAGAEPPLVARADGRGGVEAVACGGLPLGVLPEWEQDGDGVAPLGPGDLVALYTDGLTEAQNAQGDLFGVGRVQAALDGARRLAPNRVGDALVDRVRAWADGVRHDDVCLLVAQVAAPPGPSYVVRRG